MVRKLFRINLALVLLLLAGCGGPKTYPVTGQITWAGKPIEKGFIAFLAADGQSSEAVGQIINGQYSLMAPPGMKRVEVYADQSGGFDKVMQQEIRFPLVTADYNANTKLQFEVLPQSNTYNLTLPNK